MSDQKVQPVYTVFKACQRGRHDECKGVYYEGAPNEWRCVCDCHKREK